MAQTPARSFLAELADTFTKIGRILSDPDVQDAGEAFLAVVQRVGDRELSTGAPLMSLSTGEGGDSGERNNDSSNNGG